MKKKIKAFKIKGGQGVLLKPGVRHFVPFPFTRNVACIVIFRDGTGVNDSILEKLDETYEIKLG